jgi:rare lipoprotein A
VTPPILRIFFLFLLLLFSASVTDGPKKAHSTRGKASYYHDKFKGRRTGSGEYYDPADFTAAHRSYPFGTCLLVTNLQNNRTVVVRVNDRGPFRKNRIIDISRSAAMKLDMVRSGVSPVRITPLITLEKTGVCDSAFQSGTCYDHKGLRTEKAEDPAVRLWSTTDCKHAFYMSGTMTLEESIPGLQVSVTGEGKGRRYSLLLTGIRKDLFTDSLLNVWKSAGFTTAEFIH